MSHRILTIATILSLAFTAGAQEGEERDVPEGAAYYAGVYCDYTANNEYSAPHDSRDAVPGGVWRLAKQTPDQTQNELLAALGALELVGGSGDSFAVDARETFRAVSIDVPATASAGETFLLRSTVDQAGIVLNVVAAPDPLPFVLESAVLAEPLAAGDCDAECYTEGLEAEVPRAAQVTITYRGEATVLNAYVDINPEFSQNVSRYVDSVLLPRSETSTSVTVKVDELLEGQVTRTIYLDFESAASGAALEEATVEGEVPAVYFDYESADLYDCDEYYGDYYYDDYGYDYDYEYGGCGCHATSEAGLLGSLAAGLMLLRRRRRRVAF